MMRPFAERKSREGGRTIVLRAAEVQSSGRRSRPPQAVDW